MNNIISKLKIDSSKKKHFNIGTLGHVDHGKTTLTAALTKTLAFEKLAKFLDYSQIDNTKEEKERGITIVAAHVEYESHLRHYSHIDCPGHLNYIKNMITGATQMDAAILVVSVIDGPQEQTIEHVILAKRVGIENLIIFLNKVDELSDPELIELVKFEIEELLEQHQFDFSKTAIIEGSALTALKSEANLVNYNKLPIYELIRQINKLPMPDRQIDLPFLMSIKEVFSIAGRGTVVTGNIEQGEILLNADVEINGIKDKSQQTKVIGIEVFHKSKEKASAGDNVGILLRGIKRDEIERGQVLAELNSTKAYRKFKCQVYFLTPEEGGRKKPIKVGYKPHFFIRTSDVSGVIETLSNDSGLCFPGDTVDCLVSLDFNLVLNTNLRFTIREGNKTVGCGIITSL